MAKVLDEFIVELTPTVDRLLSYWWWWAFFTGKFGSKNPITHIAGAVMLGHDNIDFIEETPNGDLVIKEK